MIKGNNKVTISGKVLVEPYFSHETVGEKFYLFNIGSKRISEMIDTIPILISERTYNLAEIELGKEFEIEGEFRSFNKHLDNDKTTLLLSVFCDSITECDYESDINKIEIRGFICKQPIYRKTPLGRYITDLLVAVNRPYGKSDYLPTIAWGRLASYLGNQPVGTEVRFIGRIQSREYSKSIDGESVVKTAYEVSVSNLITEGIDDESDN